MFKPGDYIKLAKEEDKAKAIFQGIVFPVLVIGVTGVGSVIILDEKSDAKLSIHSVWSWVRAYGDIYIGNIPDYYGKTISVMGSDLFVKAELGIIKFEDGTETNLFSCLSLDETFEHNGKKYIVSEMSSDKSIIYAEEFID